MLTGVAEVGVQGAASGDWLRETLTLSPDYLTALNGIIAQYSIPKPSGLGWGVAFEVSQWAPYAALGSIFDQAQSINAGFAVDNWRPTHFGTGTDFFSKASLGNLYAGVDVDIAVRDTDAYLYRVNMSIAMLGQIRFIEQPIIEVAK